MHAAAPAAARSQKPTTTFRDEFNGNGDLAAGWQWVIGRRPSTRQSDGRLTLTTTDGEPTSAVRPIMTSSFVAETAVDVKRLASGTLAGLALYGDRANHLALVTDGTKIQLLSQRRGEPSVVAEAPAPTSNLIRLRLASVEGDRFRFAVNSDGAWTEFAKEIDGSFLPPWDRAVRTGVYVSGAKSATGSFDYFAFTPEDAKLFAK